MHVDALELIFSIIRLVIQERLRWIVNHAEFAFLASYVHFGNAIFVAYILRNVDLVDLAACTGKYTVPNEVKFALIGTLIVSIGDKFREIVEAFVALRITFILYMTLIAST